MNTQDDKEKTVRDNERKREWRSKKAAIADGSYVYQPIEEAKMYLESLDDPQVATAYSHPEIGKKLTHEDKRILTNFAYHLKNKRKTQ